MPEKNLKDDEVPERVSLEKLSESCSLAIAKVDENGQFLYASDEAKKLLRLGEEDVTSIGYRDLECNLVDFRGSEYSKEDLPHEIIKETGEPVKDFKVALGWPDGERDYLSICSFPFFDEEGNFEGALNLIRDITEKGEESDESLPRRAQFERLLRELSRKFLEEETEQEPIINEGLKKIGKFLGVDRTYIFEFDWEKEEMSNTHEWCREGGNRRSRIYSQSRTPDFPP